MFHCRAVEVLTCNILFLQFSSACCVLPKGKCGCKYMWAPVISLYKSRYTSRYTSPVMNKGCMLVNHFLISIIRVSCDHQEFKRSCAAKGKFMYEQGIQITPLLSTTQWRASASLSCLNAHAHTHFHQLNPESNPRLTFHKYSSSIILRSGPHAGLGIL